MRILLIEHPREFNPERCNDIANTPLASCLMSGYAAAVLAREGHHVRIIEGFLDGLSYDEIMDSAIDFKPEMVGVHLIYNWRSDEALYDFISALRDRLTPRHITAYGYYPSIAREEILEAAPALDSVAVGEHEETLKELSRAVAARAGTDGIAGLLRRSRVFMPRPPIMDLDSLPPPVRTPGLMGVSEVNVLGSRGCYGSCTFCYINPFYGKRSLWRPRSPKNVMAEIDGIIAAHGKRVFYFTDPNFFGASMYWSNFDEDWYTSTIRDLGLEVLSQGEIGGGGRETPGERHPVVFARRPATS